METEITIKEKKVVKDFFPCLFANKDRSVLILADEKTGEKTFSGMVVHSSGSTRKTVIGTYSTGWTYEQFKRLPQGTEVTITINQEN